MSTIYVSFRLSGFFPHLISDLIDEKTWFLTGMGSKGLLYHALFGQNLVQEMQKNGF